MTGRPVLLLQNELARHTYKPGYRMRIDDMLGYLRFELNVETADSYHPDRTIPLCFTAPVPELLVLTPTGRVDADRFSDWLAHTLREFEVHESAEWHRRDGQLVTNPHAERTFGRPT